MLCEADNGNAMKKNDQNCKGKESQRILTALATNQDIFKNVLNRRMMLSFARSQTGVGRGVIKKPSAGQLLLFSVYHFLSHF